MAERKLSQTKFDCRMQHPATYVSSRAKRVAHKDVPIAANRHTILVCFSLCMLFAGYFALPQQRRPISGGGRLPSIAT